MAELYITKLCSKCKAEKPVALAWIEANRDKVRGYVRDYQSRNPEKTKENCIKWIANNPDRVAERAKGYHEAAKDERNAMCRTWYAENKEYSAEYRKVYRAENPEVYRNAHRRRRALLAGAEGSHTALDVALIAGQQKNKCAYCKCKITPDTRHVDHITPISKGGTNWPNNLQLTCAPCNLRKKDKDPINFAQQLGRLL